MQQQVTCTIEVPSELLETLGSPRRGTSLEEESVRIYRPGYAPGVEMWSMQRSPRLWTVALDALCISGLDAGKPNWLTSRVDARCRRRDFNLGPRDLFLCNAGDPSRQTRQTGPLCFHAITVAPDAILEYTGRWRGHLELPVTADLELYGLFTNAWRSVEAPLLDVTEREHHLRAFLNRAFLLGGCVSEIGPSPVQRVRGCQRSVQRAREVISDRYMDGLTLTEIAEATGRSVWYLERSFSASMGMPMHRYLRHMRLSRAMALLRSGIRPVATAAAVGFADQSHLIRAMRSAFGVTPRQYQRALTPG